VGYTKTGSLGLDIATNGGWKPGSINELWGEPGSGKTVLAAATVAANSINTLWIDTTPGLPDTARQFMNLHDASGTMAYVRPDNAEHAFDIMIKAVPAGARLIVVDSANYLVRQRELDNDPAYKPHPQREYKDELNALRFVLKEHDAVALFLSLPRETQREPVRGTGISEKARERVSLYVQHQSQDKTTTVRAHLRSNGKGAQLVIRPGEGIDQYAELLDYGLLCGAVTAHGSWYSAEGDGWSFKVQGAQAFKDHLMVTCTPAFAELEKTIRARLLDTVPVVG
jgi:hypothetical protein